MYLNNVYHQNNEYLNGNGTDQFMASFEAALSNPEESGYFFPSSWKREEILRFALLVFPLIHEYFFHKKETLTRKNREDFIEIFYQFLILKAIEKYDPDSISFTCKDAIDTGAA